MVQGRSEREILLELGKDYLAADQLNLAKPTLRGGARSWGGLLSFGYTMARSGLNLPTLNNRIGCRLSPIDKGYDWIREDRAA